MTQLKILIIKSYKSTYREDKESLKNSKKKGLSLKIQKK